jgi:hypothetical protein
MVDFVKELADDPVSFAGKALSKPLHPIDQVFLHLSACFPFTNCFSSMRGTRSWREHEVHCAMNTWFRMEYFTFNSNGALALVGEPGSTYLTVFFFAFLHHLF